MRIPDDPEFPPMMAYVEDSDEDEDFALELEPFL